MNTILITGASSGIGKATAIYFQQQGWNVVASMRKPENDTELSALDNVLVTRLDVLDQDSIAAAVAAGIEKFGRIDALLNNAGYGAYGPLETFPMENIRRQWDTNVIGLIAVTKAVLPHMRANKSGVIANVSSVGGRITFPLGALYHGTKFAVEGLSESLHYELEPLGIKVKIIEPGAIATDFIDRSFDFYHDESIEEYQPIVQKMLSNFEPIMETASPASDCAAVIYGAITDGTPRMRYLAAGGAEDFMAIREGAEDTEFFTRVKNMMGLPD
ncbi:MAG: SDR family oxidoreductase [Planctomycetota bacterium]